MSDEEEVEYVDDMESQSQSFLEQLNQFSDIKDSRMKLALMTLVNNLNLIKKYQDRCISGLEITKEKIYETLNGIEMQNMPELRNNLITQIKNYEDLDYHEIREIEAMRSFLIKALSFIQRSEIRKEDTEEENQDEEPEDLDDYVPPKPKPKKKKEKKDNRPYFEDQQETLLEAIDEYNQEKESLIMDNLSEESFNYYIGVKRAEVRKKLESLHNQDKVRELFKKGTGDDL